MYIKRLQGLSAFYRRAKPLKSRVFLAAVSLSFCVIFMAGDGAYADSECRSPKVSNDPFADLDDIMTEEEKRQALHSDLKRKLSSHKQSCPPPSKTAKPSSPANAGQAAGASASSGQQQSGQASGQKSGGQSKGQQQSGKASGQSASSQNGGQGQTGSAKAAQQPAGNAGASANPQQSGQNGGQGASQPATAKQNVPAKGASGQKAAGSGGKYTSPWGTQTYSPSDSGVVSLEPMPASPAPSQTSPPAPGNKIKSQAAANIAGTGPVTKPSATSAGKPPSKFLKIYGGDEVAPPRQSFEEIANRHNRGLYGSPGNTGANSNSNYGSGGKTVGKSQTVKADDGLIKVLQERLARETDPEKKKQIQAEIDRLNS